MLPNGDFHMPCSSTLQRLLSALCVPRQRAMLMTKSLEAGGKAGASSLEAWGLPSRDSSVPPPFYG
jgi:hypothetical protein